METSLQQMQRDPHIFVRRAAVLNSLDSYFIIFPLYYTHINSSTSKGKGRGTMTGNDKKVGLAIVGVDWDGQRGFVLWFEVF